MHCLLNCVQRDVTRDMEQIFISIARQASESGLIDKWLKNIEQLKKKDRKPNVQHSHQKCIIFYLAFFSYHFSYRVVYYWLKFHKKDGKSKFWLYIEMTVDSKQFWIHLIGVNNNCLL